MENLRNFIKTRLKAFASIDVWFLIILGSVLYSSRLPLPSTDWVNLPVLISLVQTVGLVFMLCGCQILLSILMWPDVKLGDLLEKAESGSVAASITIVGLMLFNGLALIASVLWMTGSLSAGAVIK
jgi:hypothetical protein